MTEKLQNIKINNGDGETKKNVDIWRQYDISAKQFGCKKKIKRVVTLMGNEETKKNKKRTINDGDGATRPF